MQCVGFRFRRWVNRAPTSPNFFPPEPLSQPSGRQQAASTIAALWQHKGLDCGQWGCLTAILARIQALQLPPPCPTEAGPQSCRRTRVHSLTPCILCQLPQVQPLDPLAGDTVTIIGSLACSDRHGVAVCPPSARTITCFDQGAPLAVKGQAEACFPDYAFSVDVHNVIAGRRAFECADPRLADAVDAVYVSHAGDGQRGRVMIAVADGGTGAPTPPPAAEIPTPPPPPGAPTTANFSNVPPGTQPPNGTVAAVPDLGFPGFVVGGNSSNAVSNRSKVPCWTILQVDMTIAGLSALQWRQQRMCMCWHDAADNSALLLFCRADCRALAQYVIWHPSQLIPADQDILCIAVQVLENSGGGPAVLATSSGSFSLFSLDIQTSGTEILYVGVTAKLNGGVVGFLVREPVSS